MLKKIAYLFLILGLLTFAASLFQWNWLHIREYLGYKPRYNHEEFLAFLPSVTENFDTTYTRYHSTASVLAYLDSAAKAQKITPKQSKEYVGILDKFLKIRFRHAILNYEFEENYLIYLLGTYIWSDLSVVVMPEHILRNENQIAFCSQQATIFMDIAQQRGFQTRKVGLNGHFCLEVFYEGRWHYYDTNLEANFDKLEHIPSAEQLKNDRDLRQYAYRLNKNAKPQQVDSFFAIQNIEYGKVNEFPAKRVRLLHQATFLFSHYAWVFFLGLFLVFRFYPSLRK